mgnify:CR=1 FL=1
MPSGHKYSRSEMIEMFRAQHLRMPELVGPNALARETGISGLTQPAKEHFLWTLNDEDRDYVGLKPKKPNGAVSSSSSRRPSSDPVALQFQRVCAEACTTLSVRGEKKTPETIAPEMGTLPRVVAIFLKAYPDFVKKHGVEI